MNKHQLTKTLKRSTHVAIKTIEKHAPTILTATATAGVVTTAVLAAKETPNYISERDANTEKTLASKAKIAVKHYWPSAVVGGATIACMWGSHKITAKRLAALATAYELANTNLKDYKAAVAKAFGKKGEDQATDTYCKDKVRNNPPADNIIFASNGGDYLCYDEFSGRYFMSTIEKVQRAVNIINRRIFNETDVCLNDFYDEVGLPAISMGDMFNWDMQSGEQVAFDIRFTPGFDENRHPCLVLNYDVMPSPYYGVMIS